MSVRAVKATAVVLATVGLFLLWRAAIRLPVPRLQIGQVNATANFAYARVEGWVTRGPDFYADSGYLSFTVADETGEIRVSSYRNETDKLRAQGLVPMLGDRVSVAGTLRVRESGPALTINAPQQVEILHPEPVEREIGAITPADYLLRVRVRGQVWEVRRPRQGLALVTLRDPSGAIDLVVDQSLEPLMGRFPPLEPDRSVEVVGAVDLYRDKPQLLPASPGDIALLPEPLPIALRTGIGDLTMSDVGHLVEVEGLVSEVDSSSTWTKLTLDDGTGKVTAFLWQDLAPDQALTVGTRVRVVGEVALYRGELEVVPQRATDLTVMTTNGKSAADATPKGGTGQ